MKRLLRGLGYLLGALVGLYLLAALAMALADPGVEAEPGRAIAGIFHVHADGSHDGFGTLEEAARAAADVGARFLVLTEHNVLRPERPQVIHGVLIVPAVEISSDLGHVVALGISEVPPREERGAQVLEAIARRGGEAIPAHPINLRRPWSGLSSDGFTGFEALSLDSAFRVAQKQKPWRFLLAAPALVADPPLAGALLVERPDEALARYDEIAARRQVSLLCGVDAHGLPPYAVSFGALRLFAHVPWSGDPETDAAAVLGAIRSGALHCSVPALGDASSFTLGREGEEVVARIGARGVTLVLFRDGAEVARGPGPELRTPAGPGAWRAEVWIDEPGFPLRPGAFWIASSALRLPFHPR